MLPGPVFNVELLTTARRKRYFVVRVVYGLILLLLIWQNYASAFLWYGRGTSQSYSIDRMAQFAHETFVSFTILQGITVLLLTPVLVAGVIADEKQRKTLHYLLASQLSGAEIVLGKLFARLLHVGAFMAIGLPVISLLSLFGGVDPVLVVVSYLGTASTVLLLAGLSILVSTLAKRVRDAILSTYLLGLLWLFGPLLLDLILRFEWPNVHAWVHPWNDWLLATNPLSLIESGVGIWGLGGFYRAFWWMVGLQLGLALAFVTLAAARLRPAFRNEGAGRWARFRPRRLRRSRRLIPRPECGDQPMLWKELFVNRMGGFSRVAAGLVGVIVLAGVGYGTLYFAVPAFEELAVEGYGWSQSGSGWSPSYRLNFNVFVRIIGSMLYVLIGLGVASSAANSVASEREGDTWITLTSTTLTGDEILGAKLIGSIWSLRWFALILLGLTLTALAAGALHPFGFVLHWFQVGLFVWFAAALGLFFSMRARNSTRALTYTIGVLLFLNVGYLFLAALVFWDTAVVALGCTPFIVGMSMLSFADVHALLGYDVQRWASSYSPPDGGEIVLTCILSVVFYFLAALSLTLASFSAFEQVVDRPRRKPSPLVVILDEEAISGAGEPAPKGPDQNGADGVETESADPAAAETAKSGMDRDG